MQHLPKIYFLKILKKVLTSIKFCGNISFVDALKYFNGSCAGVAQLVEQLICNQQVAGSSPITSSRNLILNRC